jgi:fermentation-respiration switch protein FrsA (DUF1100 family)
MRSAGHACAALFAIVVVSAAAQDTPKAGNKGLVGHWQGTLKIGAIELRLGLNVSANKDGAMTGTFDSPDQGVKDLPINEITVKEAEVKLQSKKISATFEGKLSEDGQELKGTWKQGASEFPLTFKRLAKAPSYARPQDPKKPYPYVEEEVTLENKPAGVKLAGTLTIPKGKGPFPAVVLITGSGPQDRDEALLGHRPFLVLADHLTRHGIAVLRCDDRGVGGSTGSTSTSTTADFADDALVGVAFLKGRPEIDAKKIGLIGHSEGGVVAPIAATKSSDVAFIVLLAGTGLVGEEILYLQGELILKAAKADEKAIARQRKLQERMFSIVKKEKDPKEIRAQILAAVAEEAAKFSDAEKAAAEKQKGAFEGQLTMVTSPWFRYFLTFDPAPTLKRVKCPVLAINGEKDTQVPCKVNLEAIEKALKEGGNTDVTVKEFPKLNHLFQTCETGAPSEYGRIDETFAPVALDEISAWIVKRFGDKR